MKHNTALASFLFLMLLASSSAEPNKDYPSIEDTSYVETNGDRVIRLSVEVAASRDEIWRTFTTAEGWKSFAVAFAEVDMKVGGIIETSYNPKALVGDPDNIKNEIVTYIPGQMLAIRCVQAPRDFSYKKEFFSTSTVFEILPTEKQRSRILLTAVGYKPGGAYDDLFKKFRWGDAYTLEKLRALFEKTVTTPPPGLKSQKEAQPQNRSP